MGERTFPCATCGASLAYAPGTTSLRCGHCGGETALPAEGTVDEVDLDTLINAHERGAPVMERRELDCAGCGARIALAPERTSAPCPWCGSALTATDRPTVARQPQGVIPFQVERPAAQGALAAWVRSRWFAPASFTALAGPDRLRAVWLPAWTVDARTISDYRGERGENYQDTVSERVQVNGQWTTRTRSVTKVRWYPASGRVAVDFDDILVPAPRSLPRAKAQALEPWPLDRLQPFTDGFLAGSETETSALTPSQAFAEARTEMDAAIRRTIERDIGGDHQRIHHVDTRIHAPTAKAVLLPLWAAGYRHRGRTFTVLVNACTGEVQGERPWSAWKIAATVLTGLLIVGGGALAYALIQG